MYGSIDRIAGVEGKKWWTLSDLEVSALIDRSKFTEETSLGAGSPYAACKAAADLLVGAYFNTFHPFDPMMADGEKDYFENVLHKVITGPTLRFGPRESLVTLAKRTFLAEARRPLFAVSLLKLNSSLLIGCGAALLRAAVTHAQHLATPHKSEGLDVIILEVVCLA